MNICVIGGAGYVGLITGLGMAELGCQVVNVDVDQERIGMLRKGESPFHEEGIEPFLQRNLATGRLRFSDDLLEAVASSEVVFIAVGSPPRNDGQADVTQVVEVAEAMTQCLDSYKLIVLKSTVPVGTVELLQSILHREKTEGQDFDVVANPEFLREGKGMYDFFHPDRIVIGACSDKARHIMRELYAPIINRQITPQLNNEHPGPVSAPGESESGDDSDATIPLIETDLASAMMIKYASNAFLTMRISFINEMAGLCERLGADIHEVAEGMGHDPRIGAYYLEAGLGFGGPCLEKDLRALIKSAEETGYEPQILRAVLERNEQQLHEVIAKVKQVAKGSLNRKIVAVFGLAFKGGTNDVRNSLSLRLIEELEREGAIVHAYDPIAIPEARCLRPDLKYFEDPYEAVVHADAVVFATNWPQFRELDFERIRDHMASPCIVDGRNMLDQAHLKSLGIRYVGVGRVG